MDMRRGEGRGNLFRFLLQALQTVGLAGNRLTVVGFLGFGIHWDVQWLSDCVP